MLKLVFGFLGLMVALAIADSLARSHLGWTWPIGPATTAKSAIGNERAVTADKAAGDKSTGVRRESSATTARARSQEAQPAPAGAQERSVFQRQEEALQKSVNRYKRAEP